MSFGRLFLWRILGSLFRGPQSRLEQKGSETQKQERQSCANA